MGYFGLSKAREERKTNAELAAAGSPSQPITPTIGHTLRSTSATLLHVGKRGTTWDSSRRTSTRTSWSLTPATSDSASRRSEERRVGKGGVRTWRSGWSPYVKKKK